MGGLGFGIGAVVLISVIAAVAMWHQPIFAFAQKSVAYIHEVRAEVRKVSWPTWDDLRKSTMVIVVIVVIVGAIIGLMDLGFQWLLIDVLSRLFGR